MRSFTYAMNIVRGRAAVKAERASDGAETEIETEPERGRGGEQRENRENVFVL